jgi:hypothetical protein
MPKRTVCKKCALALLLALLVPLFATLMVEAENTSLSVEPQSTTVWGTGESFTIDIKITEVVGLYGWQIKLYYDPEVLNGTVISEGPFLRTRGETLFDSTFNDKHNSTHGLVTAFSTLIGNVSEVDGTGVLLTISFKSKRIGNSVLDLEETILGDRNSNPIDHVPIDGMVQVVPLIHDVAIESLVATPSTVVDGQTVDIHVIAANKGNTTESFNVTVYYNDTIIDTRRVNNLSPRTTTAPTFVWNTTGVTPNATYVIKAEASSVPWETYLANNLYEDDVVEVVSGIHDIAVTGVFCSSQSTYKGSTVNIYVAVKNEGDYTETFDLTLYGNDTAIETKTVRLQYSATKYITFVWNTTDAEENATYLTKAVASFIPYESNLDNNMFTDGFVDIYPPGVVTIEIVELTPCDEFGHAASSFMAGTTAYFKIIVRATSLKAEQILLTINLYDSRGTAIGVISFNGPIGSETTTFRPGFPIPSTTRLGTATIYVNILTDWPHLGGIPYCPEKYATFEVVGS